MTEEDERRLEDAKQFQREQLVRAARITGVDWAASNMKLGIDLRIEWAGAATHERCEWCGFERVLRVTLKCFDYYDEPAKSVLGILGATW